MSDSLCHYNLESKGSKMELILNCKACKKSSQSEDRLCLNKIIRTMEKEFNANSILMMNYSMTQFRSDALDLFKKLASLRIDLQTMQSRKSIHTGKNKKPLKKDQDGITQCYDECKFLPAHVFSTLRSELYVDFKNFIDTVVALISSLNDHVRDLDEPGGNNPNNYCIKCISETYKDLTYLFIHYQELAKLVAFKGFAVVME